MADTTGTLLNAGLGGGPYVALFGLGTRLSYSDHNGDLASLSLSGGGMMELVRGANGERSPGASATWYTFVFLSRNGSGWYVPHGSLTTVLRLRSESR